MEDPLDELGIWPSPNAKADALLGAHLDRTLPGWRLQTRWVELNGDKVAEMLWPLISTLKTEAKVRPLAEELADAHLEAIAMGAPMSFDELEAATVAVLQARLLVAITGAMAGSMTPGPVMRLPHGLNDGQTTTAVVLRTLYQAPLSIDGLG